MHFIDISMTIGTTQRQLLIRSRVIVNNSLSYLAMHIVLTSSTTIDGN